MDFQMPKLSLPVIEGANFYNAQFQLLIESHALMRTILELLINDRAERSDADDSIENQRFEKICNYVHERVLYYYQETDMALFRRYGK
jgi:hypothetical protein